MKYKNFEVLKWTDGFQLVPGSLNIVASFIVRRENFAVGFAFRVDYLDWLASELKEAVLLEKTREVIKDYIGNKKMNSLDEYTFEFHTPDFVCVKNPKWWIKSG